MWPVPIVLGKGLSATLLKRSSSGACKVSGTGREWPGRAGSLGPGSGPSLEHLVLPPRHQGDGFLCLYLDSSALPSAAHRDAPVTSGPARAPPPDAPTSLAPPLSPSPAPAPPGPQAAPLSSSSSPAPPSQALSSLKAVGPPPQTPPRKHRGLQAAQRVEPTPPSAQDSPGEPKSSVPDTGTPTPASTPQAVKTASSSMPLYMVTSFVSAPPAPEPPAPEPPPEPTKVTVRSLSPAKEVVGSPGGGPPRAPGPEGTTLRQGPPQKPYTFLEEKARQAGAGLGEGRRTEVGSAWSFSNNGDSERRPARQGCWGAWGDEIWVLSTVKFRFSLCQASCPVLWPRDLNFHN